VLASEAANFAGPDNISRPDGWEPLKDSTNFSDCTKDNGACLAFLGRRVPRIALWGAPKERNRLGPISLVASGGSLAFHRLLV
jgi:hypothetical protein